MPSVELEWVVSNFRELGEQLSASDIDVALLREVAQDTCAAVLPSLDFDAEIISVDAEGVTAE